MRARRNISPIYVKLTLWRQYLLIYYYYIYNNTYGEVPIKKILFLCTLVFVVLQADVKFTPWLDKQLALTHQMNENNISQKEMLKIAQEQDRLYSELLEKIMTDKYQFINRPKLYENQLFTLKKIIKRNTRLGNGYAVLRDEVKMKSYQLSRAQNKMIRDVLRALDHYDIEALEKATGDLFVKNQMTVQTLTSVDYHPVLELNEESDTLKEAQENIKDFYALLEINAEILAHVSTMEKKMFRLNHYARYGLIKPVLFINHSSFAKTVNPYLMPYGLDLVKILLILLLSFIIYLIRKVLFAAIERFLLNSVSLKKYTQEVLEHIRKPIDIVLILINIEMAIYIYHDFNSYAVLEKLFNMTYAFFFTLILYKVLNVVASIKLQDFEHSDKKIKHEMINVAIKIINFLIIIFGLLLILHFAGANLTAVLSGLGIGGFAVALAARESLSNFLGTISILLSDTFSQGDWIVVDDKQGNVIEIGLRVTTLRTFDNALIAIPNATLANHDVKNWSKRSIGRRIKMDLGIKYDSKPQDIQNAVSQIRDMLKNHPDLATEETDFKHTHKKSARLVSKEDDLGIKKTLLVYLDEFSDSSINILVYCFTKTTDWNKWLIIKEDIMYKIMDIFEENSLEFAFPSLSLYHENECTINKLA